MYPTKCRAKYGATACSHRVVMGTLRGNGGLGRASTWKAR